MPADYDVISKAESGHRPSRGRKTFMRSRVYPALVGGGILLLSAFVAVVVAVQGLTVTDQYHQLAALAASTDSLREQIIANGDVPVAGPSETITGVKGDQRPGGNGTDSEPLVSWSYANWTNAPEVGQ